MDARLKRYKYEGVKGIIVPKHLGETGKGVRKGKGNS